MLLSVLLAMAQPAGASGDVVRQMFAAFNAHDAKAMARLYTPDAVLASPDFCADRTGADVERTYRALFEAFPDVNDAVETLVSDGEIVAVRFVATSAATKFKLPIATFLKIRAGRIVEDRSYFDNGGRPCSK